MKKKILSIAGMTVALAAGLTTAILVFAGTAAGSGGLITGTGDFTYDGQIITQDKYGPPWTSQDFWTDSYAGWVKTPLDFSCQAGTLAMTDKVEYSGGDVYTENFTAPQGAVIVGILWKSGKNTSVDGATWANDGSTASVTLSKGWSDSAIFYCTPAESSTTGTTETTTGTTETTTTVQTTTDTTTVTTTVPGTTGTTTVTTPGTTGTTTVTTPGSTTTTTVSSPPPPPPKKHHSKPPAPKKKLAFTP